MKAKRLARCGAIEYAESPARKAHWIARGFKRHVWYVNSVEIKALCVCLPSEDQPAIICLTWKHSSEANAYSAWLDAAKDQDRKRAEFAAIKCSVMNEIRAMFNGVCDVVFIGRHRQQPGHFCEYLSGVEKGRG